MVCILIFGASSHIALSSTTIYTGIGVAVGQSRQGDLNSFISATNQAVGSNGGTLNAIAVSPLVHVGFRSEGFVPQMLWDISASWVRQSGENPAIVTQTSGWLFEFRPQFTVWDLDETAHVFVGPLLGWVIGRGSLVVNNTQNVHFSGNTWLAGGQAGVEFSPSSLVSIALAAGYRYAKVTSVTANTVTGTLFSQISAGDTLVFNELGKPSRNLTLDYSGWLFTTTLSLTF